MKKIRQIFRVDTNYQLFIVNIVFAVTGTLALYLAGDILRVIGINQDQISHSFYWTLRVIIIIPVYQVLLIIVGTLFGEFKYFWEMEKKMINRFRKKS